MINHRTNTRRTIIISFFTSLATFVLAVVVLASYFGNLPSAPLQPLSENSQKNQVPTPETTKAEANESTQTSVNIIQDALLGVAGVSVLKPTGNSIFDRDAAKKWGVGSGIIASSSGHIITNYHVAGGVTKRIVVSLASGQSYEGETLWGDPIIDLAIVKIEAPQLFPLPLGNASELKVGEPVIAIGNPFGLQLQGTVTSGIVSALNRTIRIDTDRGQNFMEDLIQTDAGINPGNSGGPLINVRGEVVGVNTIKVATAEAIGFAVPINIVKPIIDKFVDTGTFVEPYLGIFAYDKELVPFIDGNIKLDKGIYIANIDSRSDLFELGIRQGDVITQVDGQDINTMMELRAYIYSKSPGNTISLTKTAGDVTETVSVKLARKLNDGLITR